MQTDGNLPYLVGQGFSITILDRFWRRVVKSDGCWLFWGAPLPKGYGRIGRGPNRGYELAHRLSWMIHFGPIPDGLHVLHSCDCPNCIRPDDLFLGTNLQNINDMNSKGRNSTHRNLTDEQVAEILTLGRSVKGIELARRYKIAASAISKIRAGLAYRHVKI